MKLLGILTYIFLLLFSAAAAIDAQCVPASTAAGALDTCFDGDGRVTKQLSVVGDDIARAVVVQPDGKIIAAGVADYFNGSQDSNFAILRYNVNGSLDTSFDGDGIVITDFGSSLDDRDEIKAVALQPDGKIVVAGYTMPSASNYAFGVARYNPNGSLDTSFDGDGKAIWDISGNTDFAEAVAVQSDGKIVVVGDTSSDRIYSIVVRFNANGSLDNTFDTDGWTTVDAMRETNAVALDRDGKIVFAGRTGDGKMGVSRLNINGSPDMFFGIGGVASYSAANMGDEAFAVAVRLDNSIFAGGLSNTPATCASLVRFNTVGTSVAASSVNCSDNAFLAMTFQTDLKLVTAGSNYETPRGFLIRRFIDADNMDTAFGVSGSSHLFFMPGNSSEFSTSHAIATQRNNKIVAAGSTRPSLSAHTQFAVMRLMSGLLAPHAERFDFDGDGKADVSVYRPSEKRWYVFRSSDFGVTEQFYGMDGMRPVPADFDGDGKTDFAVFGNFTGYGRWFYLSSATGTEVSAGWGLGGDIPRVSDFNGDGRADFVLFRPSENFWYRYAATGEFSNQPFALSGDKAVAGDFDGDGKSDKAIFRPSTGDWWYQSSINNAQLAVHWGISTDVPAAGDYDGDGKTDFAVYRPETGIWYIINSSNFSFTIINFGLAEDKPVPADYDGDGKVDIAVFRPSTGVWYLLRSTAGFASMQFGVSTDIPTPNAYIY